MNWKVIWKSLRNRSMQKRLIAVMGILLIFRILTYIPIPLANHKDLKTLIDSLFSSSATPQLFSYLNVLSGGALANFSIMLVGMGPYINASIIMQLLTKAIPQLEALNKEGEAGRKRINQYTRILTLPLAMIQSVGAIYLVNTTAEQVSGTNIIHGATLLQWVVMVAALTGGSMLLMFLGELITEQSVGNGISLIITVGIVSRLPQAISTIVDAITTNKGKLVLLGHKTPIVKQEILWYAAVLAAIILITTLVVKVNEASERITINYAKRVQGNRAYGGVTTVLPVKLISAGVIPIIFAVAFLSVPSFLGQLFSNSKSHHLLAVSKFLVKYFASPSHATLTSHQWASWLYPAVYFLLVFAFTFFFYTGVTFNAKEIAENLQKQGGFLEGVRAGNQTEKFLHKKVNRSTLFGAACLGSLALLPIIVQYWVPANVTIGGTSLLILVSVSLETLRAIESKALMVTYDQYEQPDFFYDQDNALLAATGASRLRFLKRRRKVKEEKEDKLT